MGWFVSRQRYYPSNQLVVEIAAGGAKKAGVDILTKRYNDEQKNLVSPVDAVNIAVRIYKQWENDYWDELKKLCIVDSSFKNGREYFEFNDRGIKSALNWAEKAFKNMDKCGNCAKIMGAKSPYASDEIPNIVFCSPRCLSTKYRDMFKSEIADASIKNIGNPKSILKSHQKSILNKIPKP